MALVAAATAALACLALASGRAEARQALPSQGLYEYCALSQTPQTCLDRLRKIAGGGFSVVLNYQQLDASRKMLLRYAHVADRLGVKIVWPLKDAVWWRDGGNPTVTYPGLAKACGCDTRAALITWFVRLVRDLPATWGYYVGDETAPANDGAVRRLGRRIEALDPAHPRLFVAQGLNPGRDLAPFAPAADVLGVDWYPVGFDLPLSTVSTVSGKAGRIATDTGKGTAIVLQSFSWDQYPDVGAPSPRWPTRSEMRRMRDLAISAAHPRLLLWYSFFDVERSADPARHWRNLRLAAYGRTPAGVSGRARSSAGGAGPGSGAR
jgi:hypothetical protein